MMWLEIALTISPIVCAWGASVIFLKRNPDISDRLGRFIRSEVESWLPRTRKRPTIEIAVLTGEDVSLKWWDEEFAKLDRTTVSSDWKSWTNKVSDVAVAPTTAEITFGDMKRLHERGITSYTDGDMSFDVSVMMQTVQETIQEIEQCETKPAKKDATPPGMTVSLREAEKAGFRLDKARERIIVAMREEPRVRNIPRDISVRARRDLERAETWDELVDTLIWCNLMIEKHGEPREEECEFCDYVHSYSYGSVTGKRYKTAECWECHQKTRDAGKARYTR